MIKIGQEQPLSPGSDPKYQFVGTSLEVVPTVAGGKIVIQCKVEVVSVTEDPATKQSIFNHRESKSDFNLANGGKAILPPMASEKAGREIFTVLVANIEPPEVALRFVTAADAFTAIKQELGAKAAEAVSGVDEKRNTVALNSAHSQAAMVRAFLIRFDQPPTRGSR